MEMKIGHSFEVVSKYPFAGFVEARANRSIVNITLFFLRSTEQRETEKTSGTFILLIIIVLVEKKRRDRFTAQIPSLL